MRAQGLKRHGATAFEQTLRGISFSRRQFFVHAYQSFVFNAVASHRVRTHGLRVVEGDLIAPGDGKDEGEGERSESAVRLVTAAEVDALNADPRAIFRAVLPLPGSAVLLPANDVGDAYEKVRKMEGRWRISQSSDMW